MCEENGTGRKPCSKNISNKKSDSRMYYHFKGFFNGHQLIGKAHQSYFNLKDIGIDLKYLIKSDAKIRTASRSVCSKWLIV